MAKKAKNEPTNLDYIAHGSDGHAAFLGLVKAEEGDEPQQDGWTLADITMYGPSARPEFLRRVLAQKVSELTTLPPETQSEDPRLPNYAPTMWVPSGEPVSGIV